MGKVNTVWNHYFRDKRRFADLFNGVCFQGQCVLKPEELNDASEQYGEVEAESFGKDVRGKRLERIRDIKMKLDMGGTLKLLAVENQDKIDYTMPFRCMQYDAMEYSQQLDELRKKNEAENQYTTWAERICKVRKEDRIIPVYTLCLYHGEEPWDGPRCLRDMMDFGNEKENISKLFSDYPLHLFCLNEEDDFTMFRTEIRQLFQAMKYRKDKDGLRKLMTDNPDYRHMDVDTVEVMSVVLNAPVLWKDREKYMKIENDREEYDMCQALREWAEEERSIGEEKGIKALIETCKEFGVSNEDTMQRVCNKFNLLAEDAKEYLEKYWR